MIKYLPCGSCNKEVMYDDGVDVNGEPQRAHPNSTKYYHANPFEVYCGAQCGLDKHQLREHEDGNEETN